MVSVDGLQTARSAPDLFRSVHQCIQYYAKRNTPKALLFWFRKEKLFSCSCHPVKVFLCRRANQRALGESTSESERVWTSLNTPSLNAPNAEIFRSSTDTEERRLKFRLWTAQQHSICKSQDFGFSWLYAMIRRCDAAEMAGEIRKFEEWSEIFVSLVASNLAETS